MIRIGIVWSILLTLSICASAQVHVKSTATGGNWGTGTTWVGGVVPAATDTADIVAGSTVTMGTAAGNVAAKVLVSGTLSFASNGVSLTVNGDLTINSGGVFSPFSSSTGKPVVVNGNFTNNGQTDLSKNGFMLTMGQAAAAKSISGTGVFTTGVIRSLTIDNSHGVTLAVPLSVSYTLALNNGVLSNGTKLTVDDKSYGNGSAPPYCIIQRAQSSSLNSTYTLGTNAALYVVYQTNAGGANATLPITEANEIPASRTFYNLAINHAPGLNINDDITLKSAATAITLTSGVIKMASGKTLICNSPTNTGVSGSGSSFVDGAVALTVGTTAATRTFPIGGSGYNRSVVLTGLQASTGNVTVRFVTDTTVAINEGTWAPAIIGNRKWKGNVLSGSLLKFTSIAIGFNVDDGVYTTGGVIATSANGSTSYSSMGAGSNTTSTLVSPVSTYTSLAYYALSTPFTIVTRSVDKLMENGREFRFVGLNAYSLTGIATPGWHFLNDYEVEDIFKTCNQMGGNVVRTLMFSIVGGTATTNQPAHITGRRIYNDTLFQKFDRVLELANQYKVRLIIPFIGNADSRGGINQLAKLSDSNKTGAVFYTDTAIRSDYEHFVHYVLTRINTRTGIEYKNDPAILAWETGNELRDITDLTNNMPTVDNWTKAVAAYIKSVDSNHLLMDGKESTVYCKGPSGQGHCFTPLQLGNQIMTDIITEHYYQFNYDTLCNQARDSTKNKKIFIVGEFSAVSPTMHTRLLNAQSANGTSGALMWSLTHHNTLGGFYFKSFKPDSSGGVYVAPNSAEYRWPGFSSASNTNEAVKMTDLRSYAYQIRGITKPTRPIPTVPHLLSTSTRDHIVWQGSVGATQYILERTTDTTATWTTVDTAVHEDMIPSIPYTDTIPAGNFYYRMKAKNSIGVSVYSNIIGHLRARSYIRSTPAGGVWSNAFSWQGGIVPTAADTVEVIAGSTISMDTLCLSGPLKISGTLAGNTKPGTLTVNGDLLINTGALLRARYHAGGKPITVYGNFINNGQADLSVDTCSLTMGQATVATAISGTGSFSPGVIRSLVINNSHGVTLSLPASVSENLSLTNGIFTNGTNLTLDNTVVGNGSAPLFCTIQRSQSSSLNSAYILGSTAALYITYLTNPAGANASSAITEGIEIPASRTFYNLTVNHAPGINISDDLTLKSANVALTLTSGVVKMASGKTLICTSPTNPGIAGNATSYVDGAVAITAGITAVTNTFPIGRNGKNRKVVLSGVQASTGTVTLRFVLDSATSATAGTGISLSAARKWKGTILTGTLSKFTKIGINSQTDDMLGSSPVVAACTTLNGVYNSMGSGTNSLPQINSPSGTYTSPMYYALASTTSGLMATTGKSNNDVLALSTKIDPSGATDQNGVSLIVYPNPASPDGQTSIKITGIVNKTCTLIISDINGRIMLKRTIIIDGDNYSYKFSTTSWKMGIYALSVKGTDFIKQAELLVK